ncbi:hypothetical protein F4861DRAFT_291365 [Xylaria intraflava]|nr:hypothetical protein F4861DRAFT_291365 [Xylaria intraflava]
MGFEPSPEELQWQYEHRDETRGLGIIATCAATAAVSSIVIALRFWSRWLLHRNLLLDASDWLVFVAWACLTTTNITWAVGTKYGIGQHSVVVSDLRKVQILAVTGEAVYVLAIAFIKFSILALYSKIFPSQKFRYVVWGVTVFIGGWAMASAMVAVFQCTPIGYVWRPGVQGFCMDLGLKNLISGVANIVTDIIIVAMVIPFVWNLRIMKQKKWWFVWTFAVGSSACVASIVRLLYSIKVGSSDGTWDAAPAVIVSAVEITVGMLAISIPTYQPLHKYIFGNGRGRRNNFTARISLKDTLNLSLYGKETRTDVNVTSPGRPIGVEHDGISVTNHIELTRHKIKSGSWVRVIEEDEELGEAVEPRQL